MTLYIQFKLIIFSFLFGIYFGLMISLSNNVVSKLNSIKMFIYYLSFVVFSAFLYFYILCKITNGVLHYYSFLFIIIGVVTQNIIVSKVKK